PLTTAVINAVPARQTGVAYGINNAVAAVASLLAIAALGVVALGVFDRSLDRRLEDRDLPPQVRQIVAESHGKFVTDSTRNEPPSAERDRGHALVKESLAASLRFSILVAAALALAGAGCSVLMIPKGKRELEDAVGSPAAALHD